VKLRKEEEKRRLVVNYGNFLPLITSSGERKLTIQAGGLIFVILL